MFGQLVPAGGGLPIPLLKEQALLGRNFNCDIVIPSSKISDRHCLLKYKNGIWWVKDLDSQHGTGINGKRIKTQRILPKQILCVPKMRFRIEYELPPGESQLSAEAIAMSVLAQSPSAKPDQPDSDSTRPTAAPASQKRQTPAATKATSGSQPHNRQDVVSREIPSGQNTSPQKRYLGKLTPSGGGSPIALLEETLTVGRSRSASIRLQLSNVSSRHCSLSWEDGHWFVEDLGSTNGVRVNGQKVDRHILMPGDKLSISSNRFVIDYSPVGLPPVDMSLFKTSLLEKAGLQGILASDKAPGWITSHETHNDETGRIKYRLDDSDPD